MSLMRHLFTVIFCAAVLLGCEDTNVWLLTEAGMDAVTAVTLSDEDVRNLATQAAAAADEKHRLAQPQSPYEKRLRKLVGQYETRDGQTFNFRVYLTKEVNAFAMADGTVRIYSGLMDMMDDDELLFVIGHEMGHVVKNHSRRKVVLAYASSALRKGLASQQNEIGQIAGSVIGAFAEQLTHAQFSQHEERQADTYGANFLVQEGYPLAAAVSALNKLDDLARQHTFLSSHPDPAARAERIRSGKHLESDEDGESLFSKAFILLKKAVIHILNLIRYVISLFG